MPAGTLTLGLLSHSLRSENLGVGALAVAHIAILREAAAAAGRQVQFLAIGWRDRMPPYSAGEDVERIELRTREFRPFGRLGQILNRCDLVFDIGGGDSFADIYGRRRILVMLAAQNMAMMRGLPLIYAPQTIGPFDRPVIRRVALNAMRRSRLVATRDALSTAFAAEMGYRGPLIEASDVALRLPYDQPAPRPEGGPVRVGINISGLLFNGGYTRDNMFGLKADYPALMRQIIGYFRDRGDCEIHLVSHVLTPESSVESDPEAARKLSEEFPGTIMAPKFTSPSEAKSYIAGLDFFTGARMHACIAAFSSGVPVMPIAYSRKFAGLFGTLGYHHTADCQSETAPEILARLRTAFENRAELAKEAKQATRLGFERLDAYTDAVRELIAEAPGRK